MHFTSEFAKIVLSKCVCVYVGGFAVDTLILSHFPVLWSESIWPIDLPCVASSYMHGTYAAVFGLKVLLAVQKN